LIRFPWTGRTGRDTTSTYGLWWLLPREARAQSRTALQPLDADRPVRS
jgi:hypothetical protein